MAIRFDVDAPCNGRLRRATVTALGEQDQVLASDKADLNDLREVQSLGRRLADKLGGGHAPEAISEAVGHRWAEIQTERRKRAAAPPETSAYAVELLDAAPDVIRRPLCLIGGRAYATAWLHTRRTIPRGVDEDGSPVVYDPPRVENSLALVVIRDDGQAFTDGPVPLAEPLSGLGVEVRLPAPVPPGKGWSGAGVKRFLKGERPDAADVFKRLTLVVDSHIDFARSLADQTTMCELVGCYVLAGWLLDAFDVVGYLWPNGDKGTGKSHFLAVATELAYLGQLILAGGSYASLRDLADYGATLAFDDAEGVMDAKRSDPDKRALLLAGNRRGATVTVKELEGERWVTRYIHTFCPRCFSAIRLPDDVLASRTIIVPLVRSADPGRARSSPLDHARWPCDRRRLIDDLWAVALTGLPELREFDARAAAASGMLGRELEPWRAILAVALWLEERHSSAGLFDRMKALVTRYRSERCDLEASDPVRIAIRALRKMAEGTSWRGEFAPKELASAMNALAVEEELAEADKPFTTARRVGWLLKRLRFRRGDRNENAKRWTIDAEGLDSLASAYGLI
jgi:hypothetical protein